MKQATNITSNDLINELKSLQVSKYRKWFQPLDPLKEPVEPLEYVVDGFCAKGHITIIGASPGAGKSIFVQYLFSNHNNSLLNVKPGTKAIYLTGADSSETEIRRRAKAIGRNDGLRTVETPEEMYCTVNNEEFMTELRSKFIEGRYDAIVMDTIADYHEGNTYEPDIVIQTMATLRRFARETNCAVILITHTKKGSKIKSVYDVEDIADSRIFTSKSDLVFAIRSEYQDDSTNLIELQSLKNRSGRPLQKIRAKICQNNLSALVIEPTDQLFRHELEAENKDSIKQSQRKEAKRLNANGVSMEKIAAKLGIGKSTVHKYVHSK